MNRLNTDLDTYLEYLTNHYADEPYFENIYSNYSEWVLNGKTEQEKKILEKIFLNLSFFSKIEMKKLLRDELQKLKVENDKFENSTIVPLIPTNGRYCGANDLMGLIKFIEKDEQIKNGNQFFPYSDTIINDLRYLTSEHSTVIIIDDILGTGKTLEDYLSENNSNFKGRQVIFLFLLATETGLSNFQTLQKTYRNITIRYCQKVDKLSKRGILTSEEFASLKSIEDSLKFRKAQPSNFSGGYKNSELLVLFSHNIPNNSLSSLWYDGKVVKWKYLFKRIRNKERKSLEDRKQRNYKNKGRKK